MVLSDNFLFLKDETDCSIYQQGHWKGSLWQCIEHLADVPVEPEQTMAMFVSNVCITFFFIKKCLMKLSNSVNDLGQKAELTRKSYTE